MPDPSISIILPTWNGEQHLRRLLPMLAVQECRDGFELRAIDSHSSDASVRLLEQAGARVTRIEQAEFKHGATRNLCARGSRAEFLVFLSQDALPRDVTFLAELVRAFDDPRVAGAYARILPHADDDPLTARTVLDAPQASDRPRTHAIETSAVPPTTSVGATTAGDVHFNNVASAIRRSVFDALPFPDVAFGEDQAWAELALRAGHHIRFVPQSVVYHAHRYTLSQAFERYRVDAAHQLMQHGKVVRPSLFSVARGVLYEVGRDVRFVARRPSRAWHLLRSPGLRTAQVLGQWSGSRGSSRGVTDSA